MLKCFVPAGDAGCGEKRHRRHCDYTMSLKKSIMNLPGPIWVRGPSAESRRWALPVLPPDRAEARGISQRDIKTDASGVLTSEEAVQVARLFLYGDEAFHHAVECFATKLEIIQRSALYGTCFEDISIEPA